MNCRVGGCSNPVQQQLTDHGLCLEHFLGDVEDRAHGFVGQLTAKNPPEALGNSAMQFIVLTAARLATIGVENPPAEQGVRGRMLHAMLVLADLRDHLDKASGKKNTP